MFASIRRYRLNSGDMAELTRLTDTGFAEEISTQPGFVSYEFIDSGDGEITTVSVFMDADQAEASRDLAQRWTDENLQAFEFERVGTLHGEILVSRAAREMLRPGHAGAGVGFASLRLYRADRDAVPTMMRIVDTDFADKMTQLDGFEAYHALDCSDGQIVGLTIVRDETTIAECDALAREFVRDKLADFGIERTEAITGEISVSRATAELLVPAHA